MTYVSRAGAKLEHALDGYAVDVTGLHCADFGCNVGGFTDCLLQRGAAAVHALDTGYGTLDYRLRVDERVTVRERTNALYAETPPGGVDLVAVDLGWTPQHRAIPAALGWLREGGSIVSLIKPHYELDAEEKRHLLIEGRLDPVEAERVTARVCEQLLASGLRVESPLLSPVTGGKSGRRGRGNVEYLVLIRPNAA